MDTIYDLKFNIIFTGYLGLIRIKDNVELNFM